MKFFIDRTSARLFLFFYNINGIIPVDSNFFVDKKRVREICQGILERKLKICWGNVDGRTNHLIKFEDELWMLVKKSGCRIILAGAESGDQSTLELIQKKTTVEDTYRLMEKCHQYNMKVIFSCMIGFPRKNMNREENIKEVDKEIAAAIKMIDQLNSIEPQWIQLFNYLPYPGTALYDDAVKCGFKEPESLEAWGVFNFHEKKNPWVEERQVKFVNMLAYYILKFLNPYVAAKEGKIDKVIDPKETRVQLINALEMLLSKREKRPSKKHGNIPL